MSSAVVAEFPALPPHRRGHKILAMIEDRPRRAGELPSRTSAIVNHCRECVGWDRGPYASVGMAVANCEATDCWLWPFRCGDIEGDGR